MKKLHELQLVKRTPDLAWAAMIASHLAMRRKRAVVGPEEYFGEMYLAARDALVPYWHDLRQLDQLAREVGLDEGPPWMYCMEFYEKFRRNRFAGVGCPYSADVTGALTDAARLLLRDRDGRSLRPSLTIECALLALATAARADFRARLRESGIDLSRLRNSVIRRRPPSRGKRC